MKRFTIFLLVLLCFFVSCDTDQNNDTDNNVSPPVAQGSSPRVFRVYHKVEVVNNTDSTVIVSGIGDFVKSEKDGIGLFPQYDFVSVAGNSTKTVRFSGHHFIPKKYARYYEPGQTENGIEKDFVPYLSSFYIRLRMNNDEYYLAGWPQSLELPNPLENMLGHVIDTDKIVQYGIGYADNREVRVKEDLLVPVREIWVTKRASEVFEGYEGKDFEVGAYEFEYGIRDYAYSPFIISVDNGGKTETHDFDDADSVLVKAVLTIDGPDKIEFSVTDIRPWIYDDPDSREYWEADSWSEGLWDFSSNWEFRDQWNFFSNWEFGEQ
jgi:hypothetical protein